MHEEFMAFLLDEESFLAARAVAGARGYPPAVVQQGGLDVLAGILEENAPPKVLLLDLDREKDVLDAARRALGLCGPGCRIIFTASQNDVALYHRLKGLGAADYLTKPLSEDFLKAALVEAAQGPQESAAKSEGRGGKLISIIGTRGGVGATTLTVNLAYVVAHILEKHVGVLDLDVHFGTTALAVDKEPGRGMRAALENPERLDSLLVASSMVQESERLSILCAEEGLENPLAFESEATLALIRPVEGNFDYIFVDMPRHMLPMQKRLLMRANHIVLVTDLTLPGLRDTRRIRQYLRTLRPDFMPLIVGNRAGETSNATIEQAAFEKNLEAKLDIKIPEDVKDAKQAANTGKPLVTITPKAETTKSIIALARIITGIAEEKKVEESKGFLKGLFGSGEGEEKPAKKAETKKTEPKKTEARAEAKHEAPPA
jgi:pilus assembly protein CpaE